MDYLFVKLLVAFLCGITLFVVIIMLKNRKDATQRRKTTSIRMSKVVLENVSEKLDTGTISPVVRIIKKDPVEDEPVERDNVAASIAVAADTDVDNDTSEPEAVSVAEASDEQVADDEVADAVPDDTAPDVAGDADAYDQVSGDDRSVDNDEEVADDEVADDDHDVVAHGAEESFDAKPLILDGAIEVEEKKVEAVSPVIAAAPKPIVTKPFAQPIKRRVPETVRMKERKVLLVDDMEINREFVATSFDGTGIKFEFAENCKEACDKFAEAPEQYSLILMDIRMPVLDGFEAAKAIRAMDVDWAKQIPIIAMSGNSMDDDIDQCFAAGMDDHIAKPIDMDILSEKIFEYIAMSVE